MARQAKGHVTWGLRWPYRQKSDENTEADEEDQGGACGGMRRAEMLTQRVSVACGTLRWKENEAVDE